jgi:hypothetical protein
VHLDAHTKPEVRIDLLDASRNIVGQLEFHLDREGYDIRQPGTL